MCILQINQPANANHALNRLNCDELLQKNPELDTLKLIMAICLAFTSKKNGDEMNAYTTNDASLYNLVPGNIFKVC